MKTSCNLKSISIHFRPPVFLFLLIIACTWSGTIVAKDLPEQFPAVKVECFSSSDSAGLISSDPTLDGGWYRPRRDKGLTGQTPIIGAISCPEALWAVDISDHGMWLELNPGEGSDSVALTLTPQGDPGYIPTVYNKGGAQIDLNDDGWHSVHEGSREEKIGDFLDSVPGYERIWCSPTANGPASDPTYDPGSCFLQRWNGNAWQEVWKSEPLAEFYNWSFVTKPVVADVDNDGKLEVVVSVWYLVHVLDLETGELEATGEFTDPEIEGISGRPYGWQGVFQLDDDPRLEVVILADFLPTIQVLGWNDQGELVQLWDRIIEGSIRVNEKILMSTANSVADVTGDGFGEVLLSVFNENDDNRWHLLVLDGDTGSPIADLPDRYLSAAWDFDHDGVTELLVNTTQGQIVNEAGPAILASVKGGQFSEIDRFEAQGFAWSSILSFPANVNSDTALFKRNPTILQNWQGEADVFITQAQEQNGSVRLTLRQYDGSTVVDAGSVAGPGLRVLGSKPDDGSDAFLVRSAFRSTDAGSISLEGLALSALHADRMGEGTGPDVAGGTLATGTVVIPRSKDTALIVTEGYGETVRAFSFSPGQSVPELDWIQAGRGMVSQSGFVELGPASMASIAAFDSLGDGNHHLAVARTSPSTGSGAMAVLRQNGSLLWQRDFGVRAEPPKWNLSGITHWVGGNFMSKDREDLYVVTRHSTMHSEKSYLLNGTTGGIVWGNDGNEVQPGCPREVRFGPTAVQTGLFDWDGDELDDLSEFVNSTMAVYSGKNGDILYNPPGNGRPCHGSIYGESLGFGPTIGQSVEVKDGDTRFIVGGNSATLASVDRTGNVDWMTEPNSGLSGPYWPQTADLDGDGTQEVVVLSHCGTPGSEIRAYNSLDGSLRWTMANDVVCQWSENHAPVAGDIDGDGRDELLFIKLNRIFALAEEAGQPVIRWQATIGDEFGSFTLANPVIADVAGLGHPQILVNTGQGYLYGLGVKNTQPVFEASGLSGTWYDPASNGQGFNFQMTESGFLAFYFGHKNPGVRTKGNLWLLSDLTSEKIRFNTPVQLTVYERPNGAFGNPNVEGTDTDLVNWGTLTIEFTHCSSATATLDGTDGKQTFKLERLAPVSGIDCTSPELASSIAAVSGTWFEPATSGQGFNLQLTPVGLIGYFYGYSAPGNGESTGKPLWLISQLFQDEVELGSTYQLTMYGAQEGRFTQPNPQLTEWGSLNLTFDSCKSGTAVLSGSDGETSMAVQILAPIAGLACD